MTIDTNAERIEILGVGALCLYYVGELYLEYEIQGCVNV